MKRVLKVAIMAAMALCVTTTYAQKQGRVQVQELIMAMPETQVMQTNLEAFRKDLADNLETMQVEFNSKLADYQANLKNYTDSVRGLKETELQDLQTRMQQFEQTAMQEIQTKQNELLTPIIAKAREAIDKVAAEGKYDVIYDESAGALAYFNPATVADITPQVKSSLGIK